MIIHLDKARKIFTLRFLENIRLPVYLFGPGARARVASAAFLHAPQNFMDNFCAANDWIRRNLNVKYYCFMPHCVIVSNILVVDNSIQNIKTLVCARARSF